MKTVSFYNEKGGVGKTTFSILYASWLKYKHGVDVAVVDLNNRIASYRKDEMKKKKELGILDRYDAGNLWPILQPDKESLAPFKGQKMMYSLWLDNEIKRGRLKDRQVVVVDMPGSATNIFPAILIGRHVGLYLIPTFRDMMTIRASMAVNMALNMPETKPRRAIFLNQIQTYISLEEYQAIADILQEARLPILPDMISFSERIKTIGKENIITTTMEYPDWNNPAFRGSRDLGMENLFIDVTRLLNDTPDHEGTEEVSLNFVESLEKEFRHDRSLVHSSFPEFDFPENMFPKSRLKKKE